MPIFITFSVVSANTGEYFFTSFRNLSKECLDRFKRSFSNYFYPLDVWSDTNNTVHLFLEKNYPIRKKIVTRNMYLNPWIRDSHVKSIDTKYRLFRRYKEGIVLYDYYPMYTNVITTMLRRAKDNYYNDRFNDAIDNPRLI